MNIENRIRELRNFMRENDIGLSLIVNPDHQYYLSGFKALTYSRPIILCISAERTSMIIPGLEEVHARESAIVDELLVYYEHPKQENYNELDHLFKIVDQQAKKEKIGLDLSIASGNMVLALQKRGFEVVDVDSKLEEMRFIKDDSELDFLVKAGELVNLAVKKSLESIKVGITEIEIDAAGNAALFEETARKYADASLDMMVMSPSGIKRSTMPHVFSNTRKIEPGDVIIHSRQVGLYGYRAELERTVIVGEPTKEQREAFELAVEAQRLALDFIKPGVKASEVDLIAREVFEKAGVDQYAVHRTGHGIGVSLHEKPFLRFDNDDLIIQKGMVFSIEPGIYIPGLGGFRHSDTVIITEDGCELITDYPRDVDSLIIN